MCPSSPQTSWNYRAVTLTVQAAFSQSVSKIHGKAHHRYIHCIEANEPGTSSRDSLEKEELQAHVKYIEGRIAELERLQSAAIMPEEPSPMLYSFLSSSLEAEDNTQLSEIANSTEGVNYWNIGAQQFCLSLHTNSPLLFHSVINK